jgi:hypothetical protein
MGMTTRSKSTKLVRLLASSAPNFIEEIGRRNVPFELRHSQKHLPVGYNYLPGLLCGNGQCSNPPIGLCWVYRHLIPCLKRCKCCSHSHPDPLIDMKEDAKDRKMEEENTALKTKVQLHELL